NSETARHFIKAAEKTGLAPKLITTYGGSDANRLNEQGIETIVLSCGMENAHTKNEYIEMDELEKSAELTLSLILN
ncbi:MAG: M20/M25/M40 family metallo-hydrolase, partial [Lachnospiraceae bacterium]|nr:M20/M25/M40 family metallo-hydrolase [Lachnospiraceae bacterium]